MGYRWLVTAILLLHGAYLAYVVFGGFLAWRWPRTLWLHLVAAAWGIAVVVGQLRCPLTNAEDWARRRVGEGPLTRGFIDRYVEGVLYPERYAGLMQALAATAVAVSWLGLLVRHRLVMRARRAAARRPGSEQGGRAAGQPVGVPADRAGDGRPAANSDGGTDGGTTGPHPFRPA